MERDMKVRQIITGLFKQKGILSNIRSDQDFFDVGASSLTIVDLQLQVESALGRTVATSELMANPTIDGWVQLYAQSEEPVCAAAV
jgi:aryl carrier-like protein